MRCLFRRVAPALLVMTAGCSNFGYYMQSVSGQLDIWRRERLIEEVIQKPETPATLKEKLGTVMQIRRFAASELGLPLDGSYSRYADLDRPYVVWNVFATPEFSLKPMRWCFAFAGCVSYRGYFSRDAAERFAASVAAEDNRDVYVGGVPAYSTLGWFADPVLNTFIHYPEYRIAHLMFHELAHRRVYAKNDSVFNESFAVVVEQVGVERWLERYGTDEERARHAREQTYRDDFLKLVQAYHRRLSELYGEDDVSAAEMRKRKERIITKMMDDYARLKERWGGFAGYDQWFSRRPNNAQIASIAIYTRLVPGFRALLGRHGGDLPRFYDAVKALADLSKEERKAALERLAAGS